MNIHVNMTRSYKDYAILFYLDVFDSKFRTGYFINSLVLPVCQTICL